MKNQKKMFGSVAFMVDENIDRKAYARQDYVTISLMLTKMVEAKYGITVLHNTITHADGCPALAGTGLCRCDVKMKVTKDTKDGPVVGRYAKGDYRVF